MNGMTEKFNFLILLGFIFWGCTSTKNVEQDTIGMMTDQRSTMFLGGQGHASSSTNENFGLGSGHFVDSIQNTFKPLSVNTNNFLQETIATNGESKILSNELTQEELGMPEYLMPESPVAKKIVENYLNSKNKQPGGHCLTVSKNRFEKAYKDVYSHSVYEDLPDTIATPYFTPKEAFNYLYVSASGPYEGWRSLPMVYRGKGNAGAIAYAGMGTLVDSTGIWSGELRPGAMMQVWKHKDDYEKVVIGINNKDFDPFGHSFIFMGYVRDDKNEIIGIRIADQGYQSYRTLFPDDYEVWWAVNLSV